MSPLPAAAATKEQRGAMIDFFFRPSQVLSKELGTRVEWTGICIYTGDHLYRVSGS